MIHAFPDYRAGVKIRVIHIIFLAFRIKPGKKFSPNDAAQKSKYLREVEAVNYSSCMDKCLKQPSNKCTAFYWVDGKYMGLTTNISVRIFTGKNLCMHTAMDMDDAFETDEEGTTMGIRNDGY